jgi:hypothetical protein
MLYRFAFGVHIRIWRHFSQRVKKCHKTHPEPKGELCYRPAGKACVGSVGVEGSTELNSEL